MSKVVIMVCEKNWKSNEERIFAQSYRCVLIYFLDLRSSYRCVLIYFLDLEQEQALLYVKKLPSWNFTSFTYYLSHVFVKKNFVFFSRFKLSTVYVLIDFTNLESSPSSAFFFFFFGYQRNKRALSVKIWSLPAQLICRILKSQKLFLLRKFHWHSNLFW